MIRFWVYEERKRNIDFSWLFEDTIENPDDLVRVAERIDMISRTAFYFEPEYPLSEHEKALIERLMREVRTEKSRVLLAEMLKC
jgi:hypothetical protein